MLKRIAAASAALAAASLLTCSAFAVDGAVGNAVNAGENIVNSVVDAGENIVDSVTDAVTGDNNGTTGGNTNGTVGSTTNGTTGGNTNGTTGGTTGGNTNGTAGGTDSGANDNAAGSGTVTRPEEDVIINDVPNNPATGVPFAYAAVAALAVGGTGVALTLRRDD